MRLSAHPVPEDWSLEWRGSQISQAILNRLSNAHDAVVEADVRWVKLAVRDFGDAFELCVTDTRPGIPETGAQKIMAPFFTTKTTGNGTGLGLSISSKIVAEHFGRLYLDRSVPNTRFVVILPKRHT